MATSVLRPLTAAGIPEKGRDSWAREILNGRFQTALCMPHHRGVAELQERGEIDRVTSNADRTQRTEKFRFHFGAFFGVLDLVGFTRRLGRVSECKLPDLSITIPSDFRVVLNALNGNLKIDYEAMMETEAERYFLDLLKRSVPGAIPGIHQNPTPLSTMHIIGAMLFGSLVQHLPFHKQKHVADLAAVALDVSCGNAERIGAYRVLGKYPLGQEHVAQRVMNMAAELGPTRLSHDVQAADWTSGYCYPDLLVPLMGTGLDREPFYARMVASRHRRAYILPCGFHSPDEMKLHGEPRASYSEAAAVVASMIVGRPKHYFGRIPDMPMLPKAPRVDVRRILAPETESVDTRGNAAYARGYVETLRSVLERDPCVTLVTTGPHTLRALAEFRRSVGDIAYVQALVCPLPGHEVNAAYKVNMNPIMNWVAEYLKRLYMVGVK